MQNQAEQFSSLKFIKQANIQLSVDDALEYYLNERGQGRSLLSHEHARRYVKYLKEAVKGKEKLCRFNNKDAVQFRHSLRQKGLSNSSLIKAFSSVKAIFSFAIKEHGLAIEHPFSNVYLPSAREDANFLTLGILFIIPNIDYPRSEELQTLKNSISNLDFQLEHTKEK